MVVEEDQDGLVEMAEMVAGQVLLVPLDLVLGLELEQLELLMDS